MSALLHNYTICQPSSNVPHCVTMEFGDGHLTTWSQDDRYKNDLSEAGKNAKMNSQHF